MKKLQLLILITILFLALGLRFYHLGSNPPSLYWEEAALGYDAYSILKTGKDFHGHKFPIIAFESFGDWKPSLYFYTIIPFELVFGLNVFSVRAPSALAGLLTVFVVYFLSKEILKDSKNKEPVALGSAFLLAITPWHLQISRAGFEASLGLLLAALGFLFFIKGFRQGKYLLWASLIWGFSLFAYHANRVFIPILGLVLGIVYLKTFWQKKYFSLLAIIVFICLSMPIFINLGKVEVSHRFLETSAFVDLKPIIDSNRLIAEDGNSRWAKLIHHRFWHYKDIFIRKYFQHFNFSYLFLNGDKNPRHSIQLVGNLYLSQFLFLLMAIFFFFSKRDWRLLPLLIWLILSPIPGAITKASPHALRSLAMVIPLTILTAYGFIQFFKVAQKNKKKLIILSLQFFLVVVLLVEFLRYLFIYYQDYPIDYSQHWQYGYKEAVNYVEKNYTKYKNIYFTRKMGRPAMYYWFYAKTDPKIVQSLNSQVAKDQGEYLEFEKLKFRLPGSNEDISNSLVITQDEFSSGTLIKQIKYLDDSLALNFYEIN